MAEPSVRTSKKPKRTRKMIIGNNHHFFLFFKKSQNSNNIESFDIVNPYLFGLNEITPSALSLLPMAFATSRYPSVL